MGIGKALAEECARRGMNLMLVALPDAALEQTALEIRRAYPVDVLAYGADLADPGSVDDLVEFCIERSLKISMLFNNAGLGEGGLFENIALERYHLLLSLNNRAMVDLCYRLLPVLKQNVPAYILNTSSVEATLPLPYKTVYTGTKSFIYSFSLALNEELRGTGVSVSVLCPGPVVTNEEGLKRLKAHGWKGRLVVLMPGEVAAYSLSRLLRRKRVIVPGVVNRIYIGLLHWFPLGLKMQLLERLFRVYRSHHAPGSEAPSPAEVHDPAMPLK